MPMASIMLAEPMTKALTLEVRPAAAAQLL